MTPRSSRTPVPTFRARSVDQSEHPSYLVFRHITAGMIALSAIMGGACGAGTSNAPDPSWCASIDRWTAQRLLSSSDPLEGFRLANEELDTMRGLPQPRAIRQDMEVFLGIDENTENVNAPRREAHRLDRIGRYVRVACPDIPEQQVQVFSWSDPVIGDR